MYQRKLIQHGASSLTLALPIKWLKNHNLSKGNQVFVAEEGNKLIISTDQAKQVNKLTVKLDELDRTSILLYVQTVYRFGYDEIEFIFKNQTTTHNRTKKEVSISSVIHFVVNRLIGMEIIEETKNKITIKYITKESNEDFRNILRRAFLLLKETSDNLIEGVKNNDKLLLESIENKHDNTTKFISYCLRILNKYGYPDVKKTCFYYHIIATLDKILDVLKYSAREILHSNKKYSKESVEILEVICSSINTYYEMFYTFELKKVIQLDEKKNNVKGLLKKYAKKINTEELITITSSRQIQDLLQDLTEARMGLEY